MADILLRGIMTPNRRGVSTVECLVAIVLFVVGGMGAMATIAFSIRMTGEGNHWSRGSRLATELLRRARAAVESAGRSCSVILDGRVQASGDEVAWTAQADSGGRRILLSITLATARGQHRDSVIGFLPCN